MNEPDWLREVDTVLCVDAQIVVAGNVRDRYLLTGPDDQLDLVDLAGALSRVLVRRGYAALLRYVPGLGATVIAGDAGDLLRRAAVEGRTTLGPPELAELVATVGEHRGAPVGLLIEYASQLTASDGTADDATRQLLTRARHHALTAVPAGPPRDGRLGTPYNTIFWAVDREHDLPTWFTTGTPSIRLVSIPDPAAPQRLAAARVCLRRLDGGEDPHAVEAAAHELVAATDGMRLRAVLGTAELAVDQRIPLTRVRDAAQAYRTGVVEDPWRHPDTRRRIAAGEKQLASAVLGQEPAVRKTLDLLVRSVMGLNGAQAGGSGGRPRGVLFFAGPTGVGKTELAKAITRLIFGNEDSYLRFDMSEYSTEHSEARLVGAPPGYTGFDAGGQLTGAVRARPFRVILFDEIDKAHPAILDKFLQVLEDGRLTDGRGSTVLFADTLLVFTSNKGVLTRNPDGSTTENVTVDMPRTEVEERVRSAIAEYFRRDLQRPELFNRLGDGIVVFDFIRPEIAEDLLALFLDRVAERLHREHGLRLELAPPSMAALRAHALADLRNGGRGVATAVETVVVNPLARHLFATPQTGSTVVIENIACHDGSWQLAVSS
ncbi:AAA family ATPase [Pseudonocardia sp. 73-21]|uniref:AAA family ATPase n=1 Tax=Pseudonocardia sp. 73-21 TaxID=1895809 RepID=UPI000960F451|nr:AAA family ATPase [Pseudonocardia sp. 73-21]OJY45936.1 MAG: hypothetical protein BGP03_31215 [Pseudonocardia sp. 73-21]